MDSFLVTYVIEMAGESFDKHFVFSAESREMADRAARLVGRDWWDGFIEGHESEQIAYWVFSSGVIWFSSLYQLDLTEREVLGDLGITDFREATGSIDAPVIE